MTGMIREPHNGIYYYAATGAKHAVYKGNIYDLRVWRQSRFRADQMANTYRYGKGYHVIIRKIAFHRGGMFKKEDGPYTIYRYGVYTRPAKV